LRLPDLISLPFGATTRADFQNSSPNEVALCASVRIKSLARFRSAFISLKECFTSDALLVIFADS
jgi:hypothetical protein